MKAIVKVRFGELGYVASPYWPQVEWLIKMEQKAGIHPRHGDDKKLKLIQSYCDDQEIPYSKVEEARKKIATEKWYRDSDGNIMIPRHHVSACLVQSLGSHPLKKEIDKNQIRSFVTVGDWAINPAKKQCDDIFARYIKNPDSNLRRYQEDEFVCNFEATGEIHFADEVIQPESIESLIRFAGKWTGVGGCRKMGRGKFDLIEFAVEE